MSGGLLLLAPLRVEAEAMRRGLRHLPDGGQSVRLVRTGYGPARSAAAATRVAASDCDTVAVGGVAGGLTDDVDVGDVVVATEVTDAGAAGHTRRCPSAPLLAGELRRAGLRVHVGPLATVYALAKTGAHADLAQAGVIAVDMESAPLLAGVGDRPAAVVRAISDTPAHPLVSPHTVSGGIAALKSLRLAASVLARWAAAAGSRQVLLASPRSFCADRFPAAKGPHSDDICYATTNRQRAVRAIAAESDIVLVAGSANSSNSLRLVETAQRAGTTAYLVDSAQDIELGWLAGTGTIAVAAGASAPPAMVGQIVDALSGLGPVEPREVVVATESVQFGLPRELRGPHEPLA